MMNYLFEKMKYLFGVDNDEIHSQLPSLIKSKIINGTTEYWLLNNNKFSKVGYIVANVSSEVGKFVYLDKEGISQFNLAPFDKLYECEKSLVIDRS